MSQPRVDLRCFLAIEADQALELLAVARNSAKGELAAELLEDMLLGYAHRIRAAAELVGKHRNGSER